MATDNRTFVRLLDQIQGGRVHRDLDYRYRNARNVVVDNHLYEAEDRGWVVLLDDGDGTPKITDAGQAWLGNRPRRTERTPAPLVFAGGDQ